METITWGTLLNAILLALISALVPAAIKYIRAQAELALANAHNQQPVITDWIEDCAAFAVKAAEQGGLSGIIADKKQYALAVGEAWLNAKGIPIDLDLLDAAIEKAVLENFGHETTNEIGFGK